MAKRLGVCAETILHWELNQTDVLVRCYPSVIGYLGYCPLPEDYFELDLGGLVRFRRMILGLTTKQAAASIGVGAGSLSRWKQSVQQPGGRNAKLLREFLGS